MLTLLQTAWKNLVKMFETNTKARKLQLKSELNNIKCNNMSINDYSLKIKSIVEALGSIKVSIDDDDLVGWSWRSVQTVQDIHQHKGEHPLFYRSHFNAYSRGEEHGS